MQSLAFMRAGDSPCQRGEMTVSINNGLVNGPVHNLLMQFFTLGQLKNRSFRHFFFPRDWYTTEFFETYFFNIVISFSDIVIIQYDDPRYVKHVLGRVYLFFTLFGY